MSSVEENHNHGDPPHHVGHEPTGHAEAACEIVHKAFRGNVMNVAAEIIRTRADALSATLCGVVP
jgi:hypothetical protein